MKTIWLVNPYGPIEGENWREYSFNQFGKYLSKQGYRVIWWTANFSHHFKKYRSEGLKDVIVDNNFLIRLIPTSSYKKNFGMGRFKKDFVFAKNAYKEFLKEEIPDLIIAAENPLTMGKPSFKYAKENNIPYIYDQMDIWPEFIVKSLPVPLNKVANAMFISVYKKRKEIYDNLSGAIALGKHYLEFMMSVSPSINEKPNALVYNGIDVNEFRGLLNASVNNPKVNIQKSSDEIWCIFAGTLGPSYDIETIIKCAEILKSEKKNNFKFLIAGSGPLEEAVRKAENNLGNVIYLGKLLPSELIPIYGKCDIGLATYTAGSNVDMPDKLYDYTAAGLAVVNSLCGEIKEHIEESNIGRNYVAGDSSNLKDVLLSLNEKAVLSEIKQNSYNKAICFDKNVQNEKLLNVIQRII